MIGQQYLLLPGPTPIPDRVLRAMNRPMINHRGPEFRDMLYEVIRGVKSIYATEQKLLIYPSSGTGVLEAAVVNFVSPGEKVLAVSIGVFGDRFATIAQNFGAEVEKISFKWGEAADPNLIQEIIKKDKEKQIKAVLITHNETSTGAFNDIKAVKQAMQDHPALLMVDCVSGLGALEFRMDDWGVDVALSGSQKAFMIPPGLGFMAFNNRALEIHRNNTNHRYYWDVTAGLNYLEKGQTAFTPAISLIYGLQEALLMMAEEGLDNIINRHRNYRDMVRQAVAELGLELLASDRHASAALTAVLAPGGSGANQIRSKMLNRFNIAIAGGQQDLDDVMFRIGHLGYVRELDLLAVIAALEITMLESGFKVELGAGVNKAPIYSGTEYLRLREERSYEQVEKLKKVIISEKIADEGLALLEKELEVDNRDGISRAELMDIIDQYDALIVRSVTKVDEELIKKGTRLKIIGRAGNGVDNIDVDVCTRYGVIVANTPDSNTISAAEQTISLLLSSIRNTAWANTFLKGGTWDRKPFRGVELYGKTVGIVGLGRIGSMVATRLKAFNMKVIAYDPYISDERFERYEAEKKNSLEELLQEADFVTVHTPRNEETMHMIDERMLKFARDGVRVVNCARGGIIKEEAILKGLESGKIASAGLDVFEVEPARDNPLFKHDKVVVTPHLGADTFEAQKRVGENIAEQVIMALRGEIVPNVVNLPTMLGEELEYLKPYIMLSEKMGSIYYQLIRNPISRVELTYSGPMTRNETEMLTVAFLKGLLHPVMEDKVNYVNAKLIAEERGIKVYEKKEETSTRRYKNTVEARIFNHDFNLNLVGTLSRARQPLLVEINNYETENNLEGYILLVENEDRPRIIGPFATALGDHGVNIASMKVARKTKGDISIMLINVDNKVEDEVLQELEKLDGIKAKPKLLRF